MIGVFVVLWEAFFECNSGRIGDVGRVADFSFSGVLVGPFGLIGVAWALGAGVLRDSVFWVFASGALAGSDPDFFTARITLPV